MFDVAARSVAAVSLVADRSRLRWASGDEVKYAVDVLS
jgi:hypothetical protein